MIKLLIDKGRRLVRGYRNVDNDGVRTLLAATGTRTRAVRTARP